MRPASRRRRKSWMTLTKIEPLIAGSSMAAPPRPALAPRSERPVHCCIFGQTELEPDAPAKRGFWSLPERTPSGSTGERKLEADLRGSTAPPSAHSRAARPAGEGRFDFLVAARPFARGLRES